MRDHRVQTRQDFSHAWRVRVFHPIDATNKHMPSQVGFAVAGIAKQFAGNLVALELPCLEMFRTMRIFRKP